VVSFTALYATKFLFDAGTAMYQHQLDVQEAMSKRIEAYRQASMNNRLAYIAQLHINEEDELDLKRTAIERNELKQVIRREKAKQAAIDASISGGFGRVGQSVQATQLNIERHGLNALARKDLNREIRELSFRQRIKNVSLENLSRNNAILSGVPATPSGTGLALQIAGSGIQTAIGAKKGTTFAKAAEKGMTFADIS